MKNDNLLLKNEETSKLQEKDNRSKIGVRSYVKEILSILTSWAGGCAKAIQDAVIYLI